ncbi:MAG: acyl-CoA thioesterase [Salinibacter sp.]
MVSDPEPLPDNAQHVHTTEIAVRWGDMDAGGHVNNSRFFTYFEEARVDWLGATLGGPLFTASGPVLAEASCEFKQPLVHPATLTIDVYASPPGQSSLQNVYDAVLTESGERMAVGTAVLVWVDMETGEPVPVPDLNLR